MVITIVFTVSQHAADQSASQRVSSTLSQIFLAISYEMITPTDVWWNTVSAVRFPLSPGLFNICSSEWVSEWFDCFTGQTTHRYSWRYGYREQTESMITPTRPWWIAVSVSDRTSYLVAAVDSRVNQKDLHWSAGQTHSQILLTIWRSGQDRIYDHTNSSLVKCSVCCQIELVSSIFSQLLIRVCLSEPTLVRGLKLFTVYSFRPFCFPCQTKNPL